MERGSSESAVPQEMPITTLVDNRTPGSYPLINLTAEQDRRWEAGQQERQNERHAQLRERRGSDATEGVAEEMENVIQTVEGRRRRPHIRGTNVQLAQLALSKALFQNPHFLPEGNSKKELATHFLTEFQALRRGLHKPPQNNPFTSASDVCKYLEESHSTSNNILKKIEKLKEDKGRMQVALEEAHALNVRLQSDLDGAKVAHGHLQEVVKNNQVSNSNLAQLEARLRAAETEKEDMLRHHEKEKEDMLRHREKEKEDMLRHHEIEKEEIETAATNQILALKEQNAALQAKVASIQANADLVKQTAERKQFAMAKDIWKLKNDDLSRKSAFQVREELANILEKAATESHFLKELAP
jgi:hypothetical protein